MERLQVCWGKTSFEAKDLEKVTAGRVRFTAGVISGLEAKDSRGAFYHKGYTKRTYSE